MNLITNRQLFSAVYLRELQQGRHAADVLEGARQTIREWREEYRDLSRAADLSAYAKQCLSALGVAHSLRPERDGFILYADSNKISATGLCLFAPHADLGRAVKGDHPQAQLLAELRKASLQWGVLTNGVQWRLCHAAAPAPYEVSLEADLDGLLSVGSGLQEFLLFHRFFGGPAFEMKEDQGKSEVGLARFLAESDKRTEAVERHLKSHVEPILQKLCLGFVQDEAAGSYDGEQLQVIYQNAIYLLYRILFLFYAEARGLLPVDSAAYRPAGLAALVETARRHEQEGLASDDPFSLWKRLTRLFVVVDDGDEELGVTAYNGGLFSDTEKPYLKNHKIRDAYLAPALFALGYETAGKSGVPALAGLIDYRDLSVRHLGTLYEGLLEYRLNLVEHEPRVVRESGGKRLFIPMSAAAPVKRGETVLDIGHVYFADDKGERKASGSYYTPEDVVQYIVGNTVTPKLEERRRPYDAVREEVERERAIAATPEQRQQLERYADQQALATVEQSILRLRILDPAMGSGHFLVAAAQTVTDFIIETLHATEWINETISTDPLFWKRRVVERCIYGVDKNPLAHELAKLSLWIASASAGKPLTFLDHHLQCGNSLYGTPLSRLATLPRKAEIAQRAGATGPGADLFSHMRAETIADALKELAGITETDSDTIETVKRKGAAHKTAEKTVQRLRMVADLWLATLFGLKTEGGRAITEDEYHGFLQDLTVNYAEETWRQRVRESFILQAARRIVEEENFFHWELKFPDSVVNGQCQFDAVVANPPYVGTKANSAISALYETAKCGDLYAWLFEKALALAGNVGNMGTIVPLSLTFSREFKSLRNLVLKYKGKVRLANFDAQMDGIFPPDMGKRNSQRATIAILKSGQRGSLTIETTSMQRWFNHERSLLISSLRFADVTAFVNEDVFPKIGDPRLAEFWKYAVAYNNLVGDNIYKEAKTSDVKPILHYLYVPDTTRYFITAMPFNFKRNQINAFAFENELIRDIALVAINSNVFYWLWHVLGDGFHVTANNVCSMVLPRALFGDMKAIFLRETLLNAAEACATVKIRSGEAIPNYNFNKRMDILLDIDEWIVKQIAPDLNLPRDIFAQYKSNSFLRPLDLSALTGATEEEETE